MKEHRRAFAVRWGPTASLKGRRRAFPVLVTGMDRPLHLAVLLVLGHAPGPGLKQRGAKGRRKHAGLVAKMEVGR